MGEKWERGAWDDDGFERVIQRKDEDVAAWNWPVAVAFIALLVFIAFVLWLFFG